MKRISLLFLLIFVALSARQATFAQDRAWAHDESIEQISEHVYRFGSDNQFGAYITSARICCLKNVNPRSPKYCLTASSTCTWAAST